MSRYVQANLDPEGWSASERGLTVIDTDHPVTFDTTGADGTIYFFRNHVDAQLFCKMANETDEARATIATLTAERDALKAQVEWAQAANNGWQKSNASLAAQVAVLREALGDTWKLQTGNVASCGCHYFCTHVGDKMKAALVATPADFDCIVEVVKAAVSVQLAPDDNAEIWIAAEKALRKAVKALTPKAREMLR